MDENDKTKIKKCYHIASKRKNKTKQNTIPRNTKIKLLKEKKFKAPKEIKTNYIQWKSKGLVNAVPENSGAIFKTLRKRNCQPTILYSMKISFKKVKNIFSGIQKMKKSSVSLQ